MQPKAAILFQCTECVQAATRMEFLRRLYDEQVADQGEEQAAETSWEIPQTSSKAGVFSKVTELENFGHIVTLWPHCDSLVTL